METTAVLSVEYDHSLALDATLHTIVVELHGPDADKIAKRLIRDSTVTRSRSGALRRGPYVSIANGYRTMIRRLRDTGVPLELITLEAATAAEFIAKRFPDEWRR